MTPDLKKEDLLDTAQSKLFIQSYSKKNIDGVRVVELPNFVGEDGDFTELLRLENGEVEKFPGFKLAQINRTKVYPGTVKAWHFHYKQDEVWHVMPSSHLLVGLWDLRKNSNTTGVSTRLGIGGGKASLMYIPRGVAHGYANFSNAVGEVLYFVNNKFNLQEPDELRLPWDSNGSTFWQPARE